LDADPPNPNTASKLTWRAPFLPAQFSSASTVYFLNWKKSNHFVLKLLGCCLAPGNHLAADAMQNRSSVRRTRRRRRRKKDKEKTIRRKMP
jgi:hypothetical protein